MATPEQLKAAHENGRKGGRPKGVKSKKTMEQLEAQHWWRQQVIENLQPLWDAAIKMAIGWEEQKYDPAIEDWKTVKHKPDMTALQMLLDRGLGKPKDGMDALGEGMKELGVSIRNILEKK